MTQTRYPLSVMHGYRIAADEALGFASMIDRLSPRSLVGIKALSKARRETLPFGALILERLLRRMRPRNVVISAFGLREVEPAQPTGNFESARQLIGVLLIEGRRLTAHIRLEHGLGRVVGTVLCVCGQRGLDALPAPELPQHLLAYLRQQ